MSARTPFLQLVARAYARNTAPADLADICFVFPNKRSIAFFLRYLDEELSSVPHIEPHVATISDFVMSLSPLAEATRYEQLFILYNEYKKLSPDVAEFDRFLFWGEMILSDFNDVDRHLVNSTELFRNLIELREINSTYLTDEQRDIIHRYWGDDLPGDHLKRFWTHISHYDDNNTEKHPHDKFMALWEVLGPLYEGLTRQLENRGLATTGMFYRNAANAVREVDLPCRRYVFIGFNVLSTAEFKIFERLKARGLADFYWDYNSPAFALDRNKATRFMDDNVRTFKSLYDTGEDKASSMPNIDIIGVPSNVGQAHVAGDIVERLAGSHAIKNTENAIDTAIVLADESLFLSLVDEIPPSVSTMNVTMGFPMKLTPISVLMKSIIALQRNVRKSGGKYCFFFENVVNLLSSPILRILAPESSQKLIDVISDKKIFNVEADMIINGYPELAPVFKPIINSNDFDAAVRYVNNLLDFLDSYTQNRDNTERIFITAYRDELRELVYAVREFSVEMKESTMLGMLDKAVSSATIRLAGEPLKGLQIMGVLETRSIDFDNVIMLSMNEDIFPRRHAQKSFIPEALRRAYGMATADFAESIFAYYFYRLISRAVNVSLVYDARTVGMKRNNEFSRYLAQLLYLFPQSHISHLTTYFDITSFEDTPIRVHKTPDVMKLLNRFTDPNGNKRLSASSINSYIRCPLGFYLEQVEGLRFPDEINDYMDYSTFGTIVHEVMEHIYNDLCETSGDRIITKRGIESVLESKTAIDRYVTQSVNKHFLKLEKEKYDSPLNGEALVMHHVMVVMIREMLKSELELFAPFEFLGAETKIFGRLPINDKLTVNFTQTVDRIDRVNGRLRFVDYKTGNDVLEANDMDKLFNYEAHAIFQLMLYCHFYSLKENTDEPIQPIIYKTRDLFTKGLQPLIVMKKPLHDYRTIKDEFIVRLKGLIEEIFDPDKPFCQAEDTKFCRFCKFKQICKRED